MLFLRRRREQRRSFPWWRAGRRIFRFCSQERAISFSSGFSGPWDNSVRCPASSLSPTTHFASSQESTVRGRHSSPRTSGQSRLGPREFGEDASELYHPPLLPFAAPPQVWRLCRWSRLHSVWRRGSRCPACLAGSRAQFDSATRFSSPGNLPSSTAFSRHRWQSGTPLSCARRLLSSWQRTQSSRSLQPRGGRGFTALASSYPRNVVAFDQSWIQDWFAAIDLKDAYFHVSILLRHRPFLRFAFEGRAWQYRVLLFGLSLSPRVFTKVVEGALTPLREVGVRILNYLDDWLILAQSREQFGDLRDLVLRHLSQLGLRVNCEKSKLSPVQRIYFLGVELDSVSMTACHTEERAQAVLNCLSSYRGRNVVPLKQFQRLLGHMASAAAVKLLGLLHMRPLQHWLHSRVPRWAWRRGTLRVGITQQCRCSLSPWTDLAFLRAAAPLEQVSRHTVVPTDASSTGWGATCNGQAALGLWTGPRLLWHINCLELWAVHLTLRQFRLGYLQQRCT